MSCPDVTAAIMVSLLAEVGAAGGASPLTWTAQKPPTTQCEREKAWIPDNVEVMEDVVHVAAETHTAACELVAASTSTLAELHVTLEMAGARLEDEEEEEESLMAEAGEKVEGEARWTFSRPVPKVSMPLPPRCDLTEEGVEKEAK